MGPVISDKLRACDLLNARDLHYASVCVCVHAFAHTCVENAVCLVYVPSISILEMTFKSCLVARLSLPG